MSRRPESRPPQSARSVRRASLGTTGARLRSWCVRGESLCPTDPSETAVLLVMMAAETAPMPVCRKVRGPCESLLGQRAHGVSGDSTICDHTLLAARVTHRTRRATAKSSESSVPPASRTYDVTPNRCSQSRRCRATRSLTDRISARIVQSNDTMRALDDCRDPSCGKWFEARPLGGFRYDPPVAGRTPR